MTLPTKQYANQEDNESYKKRCLQNVKCCVIHEDEKHGYDYSIIVEGSDFRDVLSQPGFDGRFTNFSNALFVA
ncbi:hypothetical protein OSTOST_25863 [Ostertagia ostertagi]